MELIKNFISIGFLPFLLAFVVTAVLGPKFIPWLRRLKFGQEIREEGPSWHKKKSGTPTMGGIMFIVGIFAAVLVVFIISLFFYQKNSKISKIKRDKKDERQC